MSGRGQAILARFPAHMEAPAPAKGLSQVTESVANLLDEMSVALAGVRRAHRIGHADTLRDVRLLAGLHDIAEDDLGVLFMRRTVLGERISALLEANGNDSAKRDELAEALIDLYGVSGTRPRLPLFAPSDGDLDEAARRLAARASAGFSTAAFRDRARDRVLAICRIGAAGNGTVGAILNAVANALDLDLDLERNQAGLPGAAATTLDLGDALFHSRDLFLHASYVIDRTPLVRRVETPPPAKRVGIGGPMPAVDLARRMKIPTAELLTALRALDVEIARADATVSEADAERAATSLGFALEFEGRGVLSLSGRTPVTVLAAQVKRTTQAVLARLDEVGLPGLDAKFELSATQAALVVRKFGYQVDEILVGVGGEAVVGIEENPLERIAHDEAEVHHTQRFSVLRRGFGRELLKVVVKGRADRTYGPSLVNRDEGRGLGFVGVVPDGQVLTFHENGHAELGPADGAAVDVTARCYSWQGACFADAERPHAKDFAIAGTGLPSGARPARFVMTLPAGALDRGATFPSAGIPIEAPGIGLGETRFAFFLQEATFAATDGDGDIRTASPHTGAGVFDGSVFAPAPETTPPSSKAAREPWKWTRNPGADLTVSWLEHQAFRARVLIPSRYFRLTGDPTFAIRIQAALERFRPLGVRLKVEPIDDRWTLGQGLIASGSDGNPTLLLRGGTGLWPAAEAAAPPP